MQYWQLIAIPRPISSYYFYKDIGPAHNLYLSLLQLPILHLCEFWSKFGSEGLDRDAHFIFEV